MDSTFAKLWEKIGDQANQIACVVETTQKLDMFYVDKYLRNKDVEYDVVSPQLEGTSSAKVPTMKPTGTIVIKVVPPNNEGDGGNQFEQVNEPIVQARAQPLAANIVAQPIAANGIVRPKDIQGVYDCALQQLRAEIQTELRDPGQLTKSLVEFLKWFKVQHAKCRSAISEEVVVQIAIKGLEPRQRLKYHDGQFASMANLMDKVRSYQIVLNDMNERKNASSDTYTLGTLKPRYRPNRHRTVGAIYSHVDPYYPTSVAHRYNMDYDDEEEVAALELVSKKPARSQSLRLAQSPVKISASAFTKPQFSSYTYDANKAHDVLDEFFRQKLIKHDFGQLPHQNN
ncbi:hypothetical protein ACLB2K_065854 [Fragaria x ananassa]